MKPSILSSLPGAIRGGEQGGRDIFRTVFAAAASSSRLINHVGDPTVAYRQNGTRVGVKEREFPGAVKSIDYRN